MDVLFHQLIYMGCFQEGRERRREVELRQWLNILRFEPRKEKKGDPRAKIHVFKRIFGLYVCIFS